jgi:hypothetical protein
MNTELDATKVKAIAHLCNVLEWAKGNRGSKRCNPYCVPEVVAALKFLAELQGINNWLDADTGGRAV